jgi:hypothetical protein
MKMPPPVPRTRQNTYECARVRERSRQLVHRLMDGLCGCCGKPTTGGVWCRPCKAHVGTTGRLCERTYQAAKGRRCPLHTERSGS